MNAIGPNDDGQKRFVRNWLMFDEARPTRPRMLRNFVAVVATIFVVIAILAMVNATQR